MQLAGLKIMQNVMAVRLMGCAVLLLCRIGLILGSNNTSTPILSSSVASTPIPTTLPPTTLLSTTTKPTTSSAPVVTTTKPTSGAITKKCTEVIILEDVLSLPVQYRIGACHATKLQRPEILTCSHCSVFKFI